MVCINIRNQGFPFRISKKILNLKIKKIMLRFKEMKKRSSRFFFHKITWVTTLFFIGSFVSVYAQCFSGEVITAAYATGGTGQYKNEILWFTWGSNNVNNYPYGRDGVDLKVGDKSFASIGLGLNKYLCVEMEITGIQSVNGSNREITSYRSGNFEGDSMDKLYNIGGIGTNNQLIAGIVTKNDGGRANVFVTAKAWLDGAPHKLEGLVIADAESLNENTETTFAAASGEWTVIEVRKNVGTGVYRVRKRNLNNNKQEFRFVQGNDKNTAAITFLRFNNQAYGSSLDGYPVEFNVDLKGGGKQAFAIGLVPGAIDLGDAPESYGDAIHLLDDLRIDSDGIGSSNAQNDTNNNTTNLNTNNYEPGGIAHEAVQFLGSVPPDADTGTMYSVNADGDNLTGPAGPNEEDAWPADLKNVMNSDVIAGKTISAQIPYQKAQSGDYIYGWIDFNGNGEFDNNSDEMKFATINSNGNGSINLTWTIPNNVDLSKGKFYIRLRFFDKDVPVEQRISTGIVNLGEVEDHVMHFPCFLPAIAGDGLDTEVGISTLGRDAFNEDWPQIRKGAWIALESNKKGFVPTRIAKGDLGDITNPVEGMIVYDTTDKCLKIYNGEAWKCFTQPTCE